MSARAYGVFDEEDLIGWGAYRNGWSADNSKRGVFEIGSIVVHSDHRSKGLKSETTLCTPILLRFAARYGEKTDYLNSRIAYGQRSHESIHESMIK